jgi:hypothetical protein
MISFIWIILPLQMTLIALASTWCVFPRRMGKHSVQPRFLFLHRPTALNSSRNSFGCQVTSSEPSSSPARLPSVCTSSNRMRRFFMMSLSSATLIGRDFQISLTTASGTGRNWVTEPACESHLQALCHPNRLRLRRLTAGSCSPKSQRRNVSRTLQ